MLRDSLENSLPSLVFLAAYASPTLFEPVRMLHPPPAVDILLLLHQGHRHCDVSCPPSTGCPAAGFLAFGMRQLSPHMVDFREPAFLPLSKVRNQDEASGLLVSTDLIFCVHSTHDVTSTDEPDRFLSRRSNDIRLLCLKEWP